MISKIQSFFVRKHEVEHILCDLRFRNSRIRRRQKKEDESELNETMCIRKYTHVKIRRHQRNECRNFRAREHDVEQNIDDLRFINFSNRRRHREDESELNETICSLRCTNIRRRNRSFSSRPRWAWCRTDWVRSKIPKLQNSSSPKKEDEYELKEMMKDECDLDDMLCYPRAQAKSDFFIHKMLFWNRWDYVQSKTQSCRKSSSLKHEDCDIDEMLCHLKTQANISEFFIRNNGRWTRWDHVYSKIQTCQKSSPPTMMIATSMHCYVI